MKVLVVDDSTIIRNRITRIVSENTNLDLEVVAVAPNGKEAIALFKQHAPQLVTMDLTMPELDGVECIPQLLAINPEARVLVVSALADKATAIEALKRGALGFIYKPFTDQDLTDALLELSAE